MSAANGSVAFPTARKVTVTLIGEGAETRGKAEGYFVGNHRLERGYAAVNVPQEGQFPSAVLTAYYSACDRKVFVYGDGTLYVGEEDGTVFAPASRSPSEAPVFTPYDEEGSTVLRIIGGGKSYRYSEGSMEETGTHVGTVCAAYHYGRVFFVPAGCGREICWTGEDGKVGTDAAGIDGCGSLMLRAEGGDVLALVSLGDSLLAVRESAVSVLRVFGEPELFKVNGQYLTADGVIGETCAVCGGRVWFCTADGLYSCNASGVEKADGLRGIASPVRAVAFGDKYYLVCDSLALGKKAVYVYDTSAEAGFFLGLNADGLVATDGGVLAFAEGLVYRIRSTVKGDGTWECGGVDFGSGGLKFLESVEVVCRGEVGVEVESRGVSRSFTGGGRKSVGMTGGEFTFRVTGGDVERLTAVAEVRK